VGDRGSRVWQAVSRWASDSETERDADRLRAAAEKSGCVPVAQVGDREIATVRGVVQTLTLQPRGGLPALEAELYDGSDVLTLIWLGRRRIGGVDCGRKLRATGRITAKEGRRVMFNPEYELLPAVVS
jgi:hypothetical protein